MTDIADLFMTYEHIEPSKLYSIYMSFTDRYYARHAKEYKTACEEGRVPDYDARENEVFGRYLRRFYGNKEKVIKYEKTN